VAWQSAIENDAGPSALVFSRQGLPHQARDHEQVTAIARGGYVLRDSDGEPQLILIATGSEVGLAMAAAEKLAAQGRAVRVVSMPCTEVFDAQPADYRESVLPTTTRARVAIEAAHQDFWYKYVGIDGVVVGMTSFGESAPAGALFEHFGFTVDNVVETADRLL
jgi:transketolase